MTTPDFLVSHEKAGIRYFIQADLVLDQPIHIGSGLGNHETDSAVMRDHSGNPIIPGSSLRGLLRSRCERLADALMPGQICFLYEESDVKCVSVNPEALLDANKELLEEDKLWQKLPKHLCPSCRLFGASAYWASKLRIPDLTMTNPEKANDTLRVRHGVGIHRDTQTAAPAIKYDQEVVMTNARFKLEMILENPDDDDLKLLALGLADFEAGRVALGGNSARGLGGFSLKNGTVSSVDLANPKQLIPYLMTKQYPNKNEALDAWLETYLAMWMEGENAQKATE